MAYKKKTPKKNEAFEKLKADLSAGTPGRAYIFYGEETYLRDNYLETLRNVLVPETFAAFNYHRIEGKDLTAERLSEMADALPMMADRTLIVAVDYDLFRLPEAQREQIIAFLGDVPEWCCVVFLYDTIAYQPNKTMKKLCKAIDASVETVEFRALEQGDLIAWIARRFRASGKEIDRQTAESLIFTCGELMTGLAQEIDKIAAYAPGDRITQRDIDAVADPVLSAEVFRLSDAVLKGDYNRAASLLGDLLKMQTEPILILAALGSQLRRIYTARLALEGGRDRAWLMELWGMKSDYPAKLLLSAARHTSADWCAGAVQMCEELDRRMKSETGLDGAGELKFLLVRLGAKRA